MKLTERDFDVIYWVYVAHTVFYDSSDFLETFVTTHDADSVPLHKNIALCE